MKKVMAVWLIFLLAFNVTTAAAGKAATPVAPAMPGQAPAAVLAFNNVIRRASISSAGEQANDWSDIDSISSNGRFVLFNSVATNLVPGVTTPQRHLYLRDLKTGVTELISVSSDEVPGNGRSWHGRASDTGRYVVFDSDASNLVPGDTSYNDVFLRDRVLGTTIRISTGVGGAQPNGHSEEPFMTPFGGAIVFHSSASNLVAGDTNNATDIFIYYRASGTLERVSVSSDEVAGNADSVGGTVSEDGRYVAFSSSASNLVANDTNTRIDVFVRDLQLGETERVSLSTAGAQQTGCSSQGATISANGRAVLFSSDCSLLVAGDTNGIDDLFVRDLDLDTTERVTLSTGGAEANGYSGGHGISYDGRYISFQSHADNLVTGDTNQRQDVFLRDRQAGTTILVSTNPLGVQGNDGSYGPSMSGDACYIAFGSDATNLISNDTNAQEDVYVYGGIPCAMSPTYLPVIRRD